MRRQLSMLFPLVPALSSHVKHGTLLSTLRSDALGALTVAVILLPQAVAYASLVHVPVARSVQTAVVPLILYAVFGGSRSLAVGPEATIATLVGAAVQSVAARFPQYSPEQISSAVAFLVGLILIVLSILQAGFLDHILSGYLLTGFIMGAGSLIITEQLPSILGLSFKPNQADSTLMQFIAVCQNLSTAQYQTILLSLSNIMFLLLLRHLKHKYGSKFLVLKFLPEYLLLVVVMTAISAVANLSAHGIMTLGTFNSNIPVPEAPAMSADLLGALFTPAVTIFLIGYIECMTVTRNFGLRNGHVPNGTSELFSLGFTNLISSFFGTYPVFASLPRSRILVNTQSSTTLANALAAPIILTCFLALSSVFKYIPKPTLSSLIVVSAFGLFESDKVWFLVRTRAWTELAMVVATFGITLAVSLDTGMWICLGLSAILIVRKTTETNVTILGRLPIVGEDNGSINGGAVREVGACGAVGDELEVYIQGGVDSERKIEQQDKRLEKRYVPTLYPHFVDIEEYPEALLLDGVLILRVDVPLLFYNCAQVRRSLETVMHREQKMLLARKKKGMRAAKGENTRVAGSEAGDNDRNLVLSMPSSELPQISKSKSWLVATKAAEESTDDEGEIYPDIEAEESRRLDHDESDVPASLFRKGWLKRNNQPPYESVSILDSVALNMEQAAATDTQFKNRREKITGIGLYDSSGDLPFHPAALHHTHLHPVSGANHMATKNRHKQLPRVISERHGEAAAKLENLISDRRVRRKQDPHGAIHTIILDLKHCFEMDTAAAVELVEILNTLCYDGIVVFLSGVHEKQVELLRRGDVHGLVMKFCEFYPDLTAAVSTVEKC